MWNLFKFNVEPVMMTQVGVFGTISIINAFKGRQYLNHAMSTPFFLLQGDDSFIL